MFRSPFILIVWLGWACLALAGCSTLDKPEPSVGFIDIDKFLITDTTGAPQPDADVRDVWAYLDGKQLGVFAMPAHIPVPATGKHRINLYGGVISDGMQDTRVQYPFYRGFEDTFDFGVATVARPAVKVKLISQLLRPFPLEENFEQGALAMDSGVVGQWRVVAASENPAENLGGGLLYGLAKDTGDSASGLEICQKTAISLPIAKIGPALYLEMIYKTSIDCQVGVYAFQGAATTSDGYISELGLKATDGVWKKIYVFLSNEVLTANSDSYRFKFSIRGRSRAGMGDYIAVDNVRLLRYK